MFGHFRVDLHQDSVARWQNADLQPLQHAEHGKSFESETVRLHGKGGEDGRGHDRRNSVVDHHSAMINTRRSKPESLHDGVARRNRRHKPEDYDVDHPVRLFKTKRKLKPSFEFVKSKNEKLL